MIAASSTSERQAWLYAVLCSAGTLSFVLANLAGGKLTEVTAFGTEFTFSAALFVLPVGLTCMNLVQELFGTAAARRSMMLALGAGLCVTLVLSLLLEMPMASVTRTGDWQGVDEASFSRVFSSSRRLMFASFTAFLASQSVSVALFRALGGGRHSRGFALRTVMCLVVGQLVDTMLLQSIAWYGLLPLPQLLSVAVVEYVLKLALGAAVLPLAWGMRALLLECDEGVQCRLDQQGRHLDPVPRIDWRRA